MKNYFLSLLAVLLCGTMVYSQSPKAINYQAVARDNGGALLASQTISLKISILNGSTTEYSETFTSVATNGYGLFTVQVGKGKVVSGTFSNIGWSTNGSTRNIKVEMDPNNGSSYTNMGTSPLSSVPYSIYSDKAGSADLSKSKLSDIGDVSGSPNKGQILKWNGSLWAVANDSVGTAGGGSGVKKLNDLSDVSASPSSGQVLKWNGSKWVAANDSVGTSSGGGSSQWTTSGSNIYYTKGFAGIGTSSPVSRLDVYSKLTSTFNVASHITSIGSSSSGDYFGLILNHFSGSGSTNNYGMEVDATGSGSGYNTGFLGFADSSSVMNRGVLGFTDGKGSNNIGLQGISSGSGGSTSRNYGVYGNATSSTNYNYGVAGFTDGTGTANFGVLGNSNGSGSSTNYGIFGAASNATTNYAGYFSGDVGYTGSLSSISDARFKKNIMPVTNILSQIMTLNVKSYTYKKDEYKDMNLPSGTQFGFIAQDLEKIFPQLVTNNVFNVPAKAGAESQRKNTGKSLDALSERDGSFAYKGINYIGMIPLLTEAIKEQQVIIDNLTKRLDELEKKVK